MKAPTDKRNDTIQICVTRACNLHNCSNCTQLLPFRKDALHMSVDCFREAVRSVKDWPGVVGMFGGNPCCHPEFPTLCRILCEEIPEQDRRGIWTNNLMGHGAVVHATFYPRGRFNLNAHADQKAAAEIESWLPGKLLKGSATKQSWHSPILMDRGDLGVSEEDWIALRENCDINLNWSAAIVERDGKPFAYFCEVAAALDGVRGENHGIPATPGWWKLKMPAFAGQVCGCCDRGCGVPFRRMGHLDRDDVYDVTSSWAPLLTNAKGKVTLVVSNGDDRSCSESTDYLRIRSDSR